MTAPRLHAIALGAGLLALLVGFLGWWQDGGRQGVEEIILVIDFLVGGTVLVTGALVGRARGAEARRAAQLEVLRAAAARMSSSLSVEEIGRAVVEETRHVIGYHYACVYLLADGTSLAPIAFEGRVGAYEHVDLEILRTEVGHGLTGWVAQHRQPLVVGDASADPRAVNVPGTPDVEESMLVVPMLHKDALVGVVTLSKLGLRRFDDDDLRLLTTLADQAATALAGARNIAETRRLAEELRLMLEMSSALSRSLDPRAVADLIAAHLARALGADEAHISEWERADDRLRTLGMFPARRRPDVDEHYSLAEYPFTRDVLEDQRLAVVDAEDEHAEPAEAALLRRDGMRGLVMLPLVAKGDAIGLVELRFRGRPADDVGAITMVRTMAHEAAMALENARLYEVARDAADRDPLTGFLNHRALHERVAEEILRASRVRRPVSVLMMDLDGFKTANDTYGHLYGDQVLVHVAERIRTSVRSSDLAARYGGDEFAVVLPDADAEGARGAAQRILAALRDRPYAPDDRPPYQSIASIGIATYPRDGRTVTDLFATADLALYTAKAEGGDTARSAGESAVQAQHAVGAAAGGPDEFPAAPNEVPAPADAPDLPMPHGAAPPRVAGWRRRPQAPAATR